MIFPWAFISGDILSILSFSRISFIYILEPNTIAKYSSLSFTIDIFEELLVKSHIYKVNNLVSTPQKLLLQGICS